MNNLIEKLKIFMMIKMNKIWDKFKYNNKMHNFFIINSLS